MDVAELEGWLRLAGTTGVGPIAAHRLLTVFGLPQAIFHADFSSLSSVVTPAQARALQEVPASLGALRDATLRWLDAGGDGHRVLTLGDPLYPATLLNIPDPPLMLYGISSEGFWQQNNWPQQALAIVGSRNPTAQGKDHAIAFSRELAARGVTVISGLALGIDAQAHTGALAGSTGAVATIAVVGTGLDRVYPARHRDLARRIAAQGVLVSEYPLGTPPLPHHFPQRNRILCGLANGTLVVEAATQSGSLITARLCADQGKEVFAIPGSIHSPLSKGCHALIRQGAKLVESVQDIAEEFPHWQNAAEMVVTRVDTGILDQTTPPSCPVLCALGHDASTLDQLLARTGWPTAALQARLMELELQRVIRRLPGGHFQRIARV